MNYLGGNQADVEYSEDLYQVQINVARQAPDNRLAATPTITKLNDPTSTSGEVSFTNDYIQPIDAELSIQKNLVGRPPKEGDEFLFRITDVKTDEHQNP